jgi:hypothetical protein
MGLCTYSGRDKPSGAIQDPMGRLCGQPTTSERPDGIDCNKKQLEQQEDEV